MNILGRLRGILLLMISLGLAPALAHKGGEIATVGPQHPDDPSHQYFVALLAELLKDTNYTLTTRPHPGNQQRAIRLLAENKVYDVLWSGRTESRDSRLKVVPIPLFKGGLGIRGSVMHKDFLSAFAKMDSVEDLHELVLCQGVNWPDADILEAAGIRVVRLPTLENLFNMVAHRRCHLFPLSIFEGAAELQSAKARYPDLIYDESVLITYPLTMNFYVNKVNDTLYTLLEQRLAKMMAEGEFERFMQHQPLTRSAFPLSRFQKATKITLSRDDDAALAKWGLDLNAYH